MEALEKRIKVKNEHKKLILRLLSPAIFYSVFLILYLLIFGVICQWDRINMSISFLSVPYLASTWLFVLTSTGLYFFAKKKQKQWANMLFTAVSLILTGSGIALIITWLCLGIWIDIISTSAYLIILIYYTVVIGMVLEKNIVRNNKTENDNKQIGKIIFLLSPAFLYFVIDLLGLFAGFDLSKEFLNIALLLTVCVLNTVLAVMYVKALKKTRRDYFINFLKLFYVLSIAEIILVMIKFGLLLLTQGKLSFQMMLLPVLAFILLCQIVFFTVDIRQSIKKWKLG